jgi:hypothetical protein
MKPTSTIINVEQVDTISTPEAPWREDGLRLRMVEYGLSRRRVPLATDLI